jgi:hypothetical protein
MSGRRERCGVVERAGGNTTKDIGVEGLEVPDLFTKESCPGHGHGSRSDEGGPVPAAPRGAPSRTTACRRRLTAYAPLQLPAAPDAQR